jgi:phosphoglycolate phosphatase-like HAD superfamily hydrolase
MKLVCFDIDGTLIWTHGAGRRAIHRALLEVLGTAGPIESFRFDGRTDGEIVRRLAEAAGLRAGEEVVARVLERYVANLRSELAVPGHVTDVYPGVRDLLTALEAHDDCALGLLTGNVVDGARLKLESAGLEFGRFRVGAFGSDHHDRTELPAVAQRRAREVLGVDVRGADLVIVGDTPADMSCGRGVGARAIGAATASYSVEQLLDAGAHAAFPDLSDTSAVVESVLAR